MDLNQLYFDHQVLLIRAQDAPTLGLRHRHKVAAALVDGRIRRRQAKLGATASSAGAASAEERPA